MHVLERCSFIQWEVVIVINTNICEALCKILVSARFESGQKISDFFWG